MYRTLYKSAGFVQIKVRYLFCLEFQGEDRCRIDNPQVLTNF